MMSIQGRNEGQVIFRMLQWPPHFPIMERIRVSMYRIHSEPAVSADTNGTDDPGARPAVKAIELNTYPFQPPPPPTFPLLNPASRSLAPTSCGR